MEMAGSRENARESASTTCSQARPVEAARPGEVASPVESGHESLPAGVLGKTRDRLRANDATWLAYHLLHRATARAGRFFDARARARERAKDLPGVNTRDYNRRLWTDYDWSRSGEEWTPSAEWRQSLVDDVLVPALPQDADALEIGPGAGRWSGELQPRVRSLVLADISPAAIDLCRERFAACDNVSFAVNDGQHLPAVPRESVDFVWAFDVFLHIAPLDQRAYVSELARVMRPGAVGVIHHPGDGGSAEGWRSAMTGELFAELLHDNGLLPVRQFRSWGPGGRFELANPGDVITEFVKPRAM
ncbi:class I SAM-dependent methyltransferase [Haloechinothrix sp. YIM 98757]|uniref:Class I SAM-dependent methyltransferase n=1 Tax=Haloechinothrix aidingensis TaxID=2752311 RepID=A0A838A7G7_9PSEU|nr:class I SAM-dependent methyltransferase [Haloechinothrix aidingensis]MBA0125065.1 class I SAM-dependent methyltransferase [Haloechinothrix aidingensis]